MTSMQDHPDGPLSRLTPTRIRKLRERLVQRDGAVCRHCGEVEDLTIDHIEAGGPTVLENLQLLCRGCNASKGDREEKTVRWDSSVWQKGFTMVPNKVLLEAPLGHVAFRVWVIFLHYAHLPDSEWPGQEGLAELAQCGERTLREAVRELEAAKLLRTRRRGLGRTNVYVLLTPRAGAAEMAGSVSADSAAPEGPESAAPSSSLKNSANKESKDSSVRAADPAAGTPRLVKVEGRNLGMDAIAEECQITDDDPRIGEVVSALNGRNGKPGIRSLFWAECIRFTEDRPELAERLRAVQAEPFLFERALERAIHAKAGRYREVMDGAILTPGALQKWWVSIERMRPAKGGLTPEEIERLGAAL